MCYCSQLYGKSDSASIVKTNSIGFLDLRDIQPVNVIPDGFLHFFRSSLDLCVCEIWLVEEGSILQQALPGFSGKEIFSFHQVFFSWEKLRQKKIEQLWKTSIREWKNLQLYLSLNQKIFLVNFIKLELKYLQNYSVFLCLSFSRERKIWGLDIIYFPENLSLELLWYCDLAISFFCWPEIRIWSSLASTMGLTFWWNWNDFDQHDVNLCFF